MIAASLSMLRAIVQHIITSSADHPLPVASIREIFSHTSRPYATEEWPEFVSLRPYEQSRLAATIYFRTGDSSVAFREFCGTIAGGNASDVSSGSDEAEAEVVGHRNEFDDPDLGGSGLDEGALKTLLESEQATELYFTQHVEYFAPQAIGGKGFNADNIRSFTAKLPEASPSAASSHVGSALRHTGSIIPSSAYVHGEADSECGHCSTPAQAIFASSLSTCALSEYTLARLRNYDKDLDNTIVYFNDEREQVGRAIKQIREKLESSKRNRDLFRNLKSTLRAEQEILARETREAINPMRVTADSSASSGIIISPHVVHERLQILHQNKWRNVSEAYGLPPAEKRNRSLGPSINNSASAAHGSRYEDEGASPEGSDQFGTHGEPIAPETECTSHENAPLDMNSSSPGQFLQNTANFKASSFTPAPVNPDLMDVGK